MAAHGELAQNSRRLYARHETIERFGVNGVGVTLQLGDQEDVQKQADAVESPSSSISESTAWPLQKREILKIQ